MNVCLQSQFDLGLWRGSLWPVIEIALLVIPAAISIWNGYWQVIVFIRLAPYSRLGTTAIGKFMEQPIEDVITRNTNHAG